ncbi:MAG: nucleoside triphosphate pyrophosphohydrolase [Limnochordia bacterium]|jgi:tetrapyrrole methylase family protein/MazG family protein|nr:nucleoside triphosphate pyrophosphohydrolase [Bacillota bacterium]HOB08274.1 nucleoside triphosphate pyrophosphohydrolase [Limnochordia bacterium]NLH30555.1 nucleoside triphosphate pyrophosphohydrolase [Bacillota bacterium]HPT92558.1 nucleoside triphosphate pyrophosphohydrolase [Limnochordia bacterium]HPZ30515.1 nucleoside triphosphate pyrophosphohydrolase [Limnochordia bacterium]
MPKYTLQSLLDIMAKLRSEQGCPWDKQQTHDSLTRYLLEEAYEVIDAIEEKDFPAVAEELGDLLLQIVFHAQIGAESGKFTMDDVIAAICEKMIRRHPHVFGDTAVESVQDVLTNWEAIKMQEKPGQDDRSLLDGVPKHLPALLRAERIQDKAAKVGFQWDQVEGAVIKLEEELKEFRQAVQSRDQAEMEAEMGDLFFSLVNICRYLDINPERALNTTTDKFAKRFRYIEKQARLQGKDLHSMSLKEMDQFWEEAKKDS